MEKPNRRGVDSDMRVIQILIFGLIVATTQMSCSTAQKIRKFSGDGKIIEAPAPLFAENGYYVEFERLKLGSPVEATYRFTGLPKVAWRVQTSLRILDDRDWVTREYYEWYRDRHSNSVSNYMMKENLSATLQVSLTDETGRTIYNIQRKFADLSWSRAGNGPWMVEAPDDEMCFSANSNSHYLLSIKIDSEPLFQGKEAFVVLKSGIWGK